MWLKSSTENSTTELSQKFEIEKWIKISLINLAIVAGLGVLMRYKIGFEFPYFNQKFIQHGHSHFAFAGWISQTLMVFMIAHLQKRSGINTTLYKRILIANLIFAYGMLITFVINGYNVISICISQGSTFVSYFFAFQYIRDLNKTTAKPTDVWFKSALIFNIISSIGTYVLAFTMSTGKFNQELYLGSIYFFLHFQYNGWFIFACIGLMIDYLNLSSMHLKIQRHIPLTMSFTCFFTYLLSVLWLKLPNWAFYPLILITGIQLILWFQLFKTLFRAVKASNSISPIFKWILLITSISLSIKFVLQFVSLQPYISQLAFGFRPIIIAYLHLVFLAIVSVFLIVYARLTGGIKLSSFAVSIFVFGVYCNEILLTAQGVASFSYTIIPHIETYLFIASLIILTGILSMIFMKSAIKQ